MVMSRNDDFFSTRWIHFFMEITEDDPFQKAFNVINHGSLCSTNSNPSGELLNSMVFALHFHK